MDHGTEEMELLLLNPRPLKRRWEKKYENKKKKENQVGEEKAGGGVKETDEETGMKWNSVPLRYSWLPAGLRSEAQGLLFRRENPLAPGRRNDGARGWRDAAVRYRYRRPGALPARPAPRSPRRPGTGATEERTWGLQGQRAQPGSPVRTDACVSPAPERRKIARAATGGEALSRLRGE